VKYFVTTLKRGAVPGEKHGQLWLCDFASRTAEILVELDHLPQSANPRGGDRGYRGVAIDRSQNQIWLTRFDCIEIYDHDLNFLEAVHHRLFLHLHDLSICGQRCLITSTGENLVLEFDVARRNFVASYSILDNRQGVPRVNSSEDPEIAPAHDVYHHLNSIYVSTDHILTSGAQSQMLFRLTDQTLTPVTVLPKGVHNTLQMPDGTIVFLDSEGHRVGLQTGQDLRFVPVPPIADLEAQDPADKERWRVARPYYTRGLCVSSNSKVIFGHSPISLCILDTRSGTIEDQWVLSRDISWMVSGISEVAW
jgi:hypothetical protein